MEFNKNTEIRHLPENIREILVRSFEGDSWKILMEGIPKELAENSDVDVENNFPKKYSPDEIKLVHNYCMKEKLNFPVLVLFDEWGSSGKIRPTLGHLLKILSKLQLYRAADYLCILLKEPMPKRPDDGPGAPVEFISFAELPVPTSITGSYGDNKNKTNDNNKNYSIQNKVQLPEKPIETVVISTIDHKEEIIPGPSAGPYIPKLGMLMSGTNSISSTADNEINENVNISNIPDINQLRVIQNLTESETFGPKFDVLMTGSSSISSTTNTDTNGSISNQPDISELRPNLNLTESFGPSPIPNLSAFYPSISNAHDTNHNITTNGYGEIENIQFSEIQSATEHFHDSRKLGEGGFSTVYLAINLRPGFKCSAIKRLHTSHAKSSEHFFREIQLLKNVDHKNLIKLLGYTSNPDEMCFVYEYVEGGNLYEKLEKCRRDKEVLHWRDRIEIARGCSEGIKYLHSNLVNIIHRDIKSSNILLDGNIPKICDFGFVKNANFNTATIAVGTNPYMAPETVRGHVTIAVDIFAFGVVILELVSGFNVLDESKPNEVIDLVTYFETSLKQPNYHITFTDNKAGDWKHLNFIKTAAEELLELARKCLVSKSDRLQILDVNSGLTQIYNNYCI